MTTEQDSRLASRNQSAAKQDRAEQDRPATQDRKISDSDRLAMFRQTFFQSALPDLPKIPGFHVCWLTTNNPRDTIMQRQRLGYEPIKSSDVPGWEYISIKTGDYAGCFGVNEMVAFKLPLDLYKMYMNEAHHIQPLQEEQKLRAVIDAMKDEAKEKKAEILEEAGTAELGKKAPREGKFEGLN